MGTMNFSKLKLNEGVATGNNAFAGAERAKEGANNSEQQQLDPARKQAQMKQRAGRDGTVKQGNQILNHYDLRAVERERAIQRSKVNWRDDLAEAAEPQDDPEHPYVEVMPHWKYKEKEAVLNAIKAGVKDKAMGKPPLTTPVSEEKQKLIEDTEFDKIWEAITKVPIYNKDATQAPRENAARRVANKVHDKTKAQKKAIEPMKTDAFSGK